ncbi:MAG: nucleotidyltransferase domain-containing protein [Gemmatimonadaceae bacterium]|nr:nucleotidyltransferase domain-containing protein [Gemmatimonadaceae bacterium]
MAKMTLDDLIAQLRAIYGNDLVAVALYGSAARGEHIAKHSDLNVLVVVEHITMEHLHREAPIARGWREAGNPPPLTMTRTEWLGGADIFPMEYADILAHHHVLAGDLPIAGIVVDMKDLRLQLEHEAMSKLFRMRHAILLADGDQKALRTMLTDSVSTVMVLFRAVLRMYGEAPSADSLVVCERVSERTTLDTSAVQRVLRHVRHNDPMPAGDLAAVVERYLATVQSLAAWLDAYVP